MLIALTPSIGGAILSAPRALSGMLEGGLLSVHDESALAELQGIVGAIGVAMEGEQGIQTQLHVLSLMGELPATPNTLLQIAQDLSLVDGDAYSSAAARVLKKIERGMLRIHDRKSTREQLLYALSTSSIPAHGQVLVQEFKKLKRMRMPPDVVGAMVLYLEGRNIDWRSGIHIVDAVESLMREYLLALQKMDIKMVGHWCAKLLEHVGKVEKKHFKLYLDMGMTLARAGLFLEANTWLVRAVAADDESPRGWKYLGYVATLLGNAQAALDCFNKALQIEQETCDATLMAKGLAFLWFGELEKGLNILRLKALFLRTKDKKWKGKVGDHVVSWDITGDRPPRYQFQLPIFMDLFNLDPPPLVF
ncbi:MAG: tetratricopeptide repeat protein, partial [bacterium]|nr:tetratricopeptide repeat protein [bacterium]